MRPFGNVTEAERQEASRQAARGGIVGAARVSVSCLIAS